MTDKTYINWTSLSDKSISEYIGAYIKYHRLAQNKTQDEIAHAAGIGRSTLSLLERGDVVTMSTFIQVLRVLDLLQALDVFKVEQQISPIALAKMERNKRQRAGTKKKGNTNESTW